MHFHENLSKIMYESKPENTPEIDDNLDKEKIQELRSDFLDRHKYFEVYYALL